MEDQLQRLHEEYAVDRAASDFDALRRQRRDRRNATLAGGMIGIVSTLATAPVTRRAIYWHSFLLEALLGALAGYLLMRLRPDPLGGILLFSGAYLLAWFVRAIGFDPSVAFLIGDLRGAAMIQGNLASLSFTVACGAAMGQVMSD